MFDPLCWSECEGQSPAMHLQTQAHHIQKCDRGATANSVTTVAVKRSAGLDVASVGGTVVLLCGRLAGVPDLTLGEAHGSA